MVRPPIVIYPKQELMIHSKSRAFVVILVMILGGLNCSVLSQKNSKDVLSAAIYTEYPILDESGNLTYLRDTVYYYQYKGNSFYELTFIELSEDSIGKEMPIHAKKTQFFVFDRNDTIGKFFYASDSGYHLYPYNAYQKVDTVLRNRAYKADFGAISDSFRLTFTENKFDTVIEKYALSPSNRWDLSDSVFFYFSNEMKDLKYSWAPKLEVKLKLKLIKVEFLFNEKISNHYNYIMPRRKLVFILTPLLESIPKSKIEFIKNYSSTNNRM